MIVNALNEVSTNAAVLQSYKKDGFNITISTSNIPETERQKLDIIIKGKLTDILNKSKQ